MLAAAQGATMDEYPDYVGPEDGPTEAERIERELSLTLHSGVLRQ